jgi:hypothetical protein
MFSHSQAEALQPKLVCIFLFFPVCCIYLIKLHSRRDFWQPGNGIGRQSHVCFIFQNGATTTVFLAEVCSSALQALNMFILIRNSTGVFVYLTMLFQIHMLYSVE